MARCIDCRFCVRVDTKPGDVARYDCRDPGDLGGSVDGMSAEFVRINDLGCESFEPKAPSKKKRKPASAAPMTFSEPTPNYKADEALQPIRKAYRDVGELLDGLSGLAAQEARLMLRLSFALAEDAVRGE